MINVFHKDSEGRYIRYRTAYIKEDENQIPFKYWKMSDTDIANEDFLKGIEMSSTTIVIRTMYDYKFTVHTKVLIDNRPYKVSTIRKEEDECANGVFRNEVKPYTYLVLVG